MILRVAAALAVVLFPPPALAAETPVRVPPDRAAMSQFLAAPIEPATAAGTSDRSAVPTRKAKRVRYTIPATKRM